MLPSVCMLASDLRRLLELVGLPACLLVGTVGLVVGGGGHLSLLGTHVGPHLLRLRDRLIS
jgi:hypothetical protein